MNGFSPFPSPLLPPGSTVRHWRRCAHIYTTHAFFVFLLLYYYRHFFSFSYNFFIFFTIFFIFWSRALAFHQHPRLWPTPFRVLSAASVLAFGLPRLFYFLSYLLLIVISFHFLVTFLFFTIFYLFWTLGRTWTCYVLRRDSFNLVKPPVISFLHVLYRH